MVIGGSDFSDFGGGGETRTNDLGESNALSGRPVVTKDSKAPPDFSEVKIECTPHFSHLSDDSLDTITKKIQEIADNLLREMNQSSHSKLTAESFLTGKKIVIVVVRRTDEGKFEIGVLGEGSNRGAGGFKRVEGTYKISSKFFSTISRNYLTLTPKTPEIPYPGASQEVIDSYEQTKKLNEQIFQREAELYKTLGQKGVPIVSKAIDKADPNRMIVEYCEGGDFADYLRKSEKIGKKLTEKEVYSLFSGMIDSLVGIHDKGYVHLDIKPTNVLIQETPHLKAFLDDLGIATEIKGELSHYGSCGYIPPEIIETEKACKADPKMDIWSLGMTFVSITYLLSHSDSKIIDPVAQVANLQTQILRLHQIKLENINSQDKQKALLSELAAKIQTYSIIPDVQSKWFDAILQKNIQTVDEFIKELRTVCLEMLKSKCKEIQDTLSDSPLDSLIKRMIAYNPDERPPLQEVQKVMAALGSIK